MAALRSSTEGHLPPLMEQKSFAQLFTSAPTFPTPTKPLLSYKGEAAVFFSMEDITKLASPFRLSLVGKFSRGRPKLEDIRKFIRFLDLKDTCMVRHMDSRHVLIRCSSESDFHCLRLRGIWYVEKFTIRVFKWSASFHVNRESLLVPVWFSIPGLPVHFFNKHSLFSIVHALGKPLFLDAATVNLTSRALRVSASKLTYFVLSQVECGLELRTLVRVSGSHCRRRTYPNIAPVVGTWVIPIVVAKSLFWLDRRLTHWRRSQRAWLRCKQG